MKKVVLFLFVLFSLLYFIPKLVFAQEGVSCASLNITYSTDPNPVTDRASEITINFQNVPNGTYSLRFGCGFNCERTTPADTVTNGHLSIPVDNNDGKLNPGNHVATLIFPTNAQAFCGDVSYNVVNTSDRCNQVTVLNVSPTSGNRTTMFSISGVVSNCVSTNITLVAEDSTDPNHVVVLRPELMTNSNGSFEVRDISFPEAGTWNVQVWLAGSPITQGMTRTVTITNEGGSVFRCGEVVGADDPNRCPPECPPTNVGGTWFCGNLDEGTRARCQTGVNVATLEACRLNTNLPQAATCTKDGQPGFVCIDSSQTFCRAADNSLRCQTIPSLGAVGSKCNIKTGVKDDANGTGVLTAVGCVPVYPNELIPAFVKFAAGISGGIALLLMVLGAFQMLTSGGNPEGIKKGRDQFVAAGIGLLFIIFSVTLLQIIGVDILDLPGFR